MKHFSRPTQDFMNNFYTNSMGYPIIFVHEKTNEIICERCAIELAFNPDPLEADDNDLYKHYVYDVYYEGPIIYCDRCNKEIKSAYGNPEEENKEE